MTYASIHSGDLCSKKVLTLNTAVVAIKFQKTLSQPFACGVVSGASGSRRAGVGGIGGKRRKVEGEMAYRHNKGITLLDNIVISRVDLVDTFLKRVDIKLLPWCR